MNNIKMCKNMGVRVAGAYVISDTPKKEEAPEIKYPVVVMAVARASPGGETTIQ